MRQIFFQKVVFGPPLRGEAMYDLKIRGAGDPSPGSATEILAHKNYGLWPQLVTTAIFMKHASCL